MIELIIICVIVGAGFFFQKKYKPTATKYASTAYVLWFFSIFGLLGFHRHYLGKYGTGCLWMFTCGCFGIGALVDLLTLTNQVNQHNTALRANLFSQNQNQQTNTQINFQATTYSKTTAQQIKPLQSNNVATKERPIKQNFADDIIKTINRAQTDLHTIEVIEESKTISVLDKTYGIKSQIQPEAKKTEQTEKVIISEDIPSKIEVSKIHDTEASIVQHLSREVGKITKLSGKIGSGELKLFIASDDWKKLPLSFLPTLSFEFELDNKYNFIIVRSSNKNISGLKKLDSLKICFEDGNFIEKKFGVDRSLKGNNVHNVISLTDLELKTLSENKVSGVETFSGLRIPYEFTENENEQYASAEEGKQLFKIVCEKLVEINLILKKTNTNDSLAQTFIKEKEETLNNSNSANNASSLSSENNSKEIGSVIQSLTDSKKLNTVEPVSDIAEDDSIIDITDEAYIIKKDTDLIKYMPGVPYWPHQYVYSYNELNAASEEQKKFYIIFRSNFINRKYYDLEGNNNYAFILLFDLLKDFDSHKIISILEKDLSLLGTFYPKTKSYAELFLRAKKDVKVKDSDSLRFTTEDKYSYHNSFVDYDTFNWRNKYKKSLNLSENDTKFLDKVLYPNNNFTNIEYCCTEIIKLYIATIAELKKLYKAEETTLEDDLIDIADIVVRKHYKYRSGSQNYKYAIQPATNELYNTIFKYCENSVREAYGHKRKINTALKYNHDEVKTAFEDKIVLKLNTILPTLITSITPPDDATELELNTQNTVRWKSKFAEITTNFSGTAEAFVEAIIALGKTNKNNPSVENIFFEASKFIAKQSKEAALKLYVYYLYYDLKSATFDNKQLTKTVQKSLFSTNEQLHTFEQIISELINDKNLEKALNAVTNVYAVKRKKIELDRTTIKEVQQLHSGTVELLNEYLRDDFEDDNNTIKAEEISTEEIQIEITQKTETAHHSIYLSELPFTSDHISVLELFSKNSLSILQSEMEEFAKAKGIFKNQIIESINETCYETLDDVLIEEDDDYYTILPEYYNKIIAL